MLPNGSGRYLWRGVGWEVAPKKKRLGKQNFERVKGWVNEKKKTQGLANKNLLAFPKHNPLKY